MNEHGGHIHYPAFLGNKPVTAEDVNTIIAYAGRRPGSIRTSDDIHNNLIKAMLIAQWCLSEIQQESR